MSRDSGATSPRHSSQRSTSARALLIAIVASLAVTSIFAVLVISHLTQQEPVTPLRPFGIPANIPTALADQMGLSPTPNRPAPGFKLVDQSGRTFALSSFRGRAVVLEFMDPHCVDICPIVDAYRNLGTLASEVVFVAINVNPNYRTTSDVLSFTREHNLSIIPDWHFLTGSLDALQAVWKHFGIEVIVPKPRGDVIHTSLLFFIDRWGHERFLASPMVEHTSSGKAYLPSASIASWGRGIELVARQLAG
jgi:cytochrome oxidase Cu insertion factor (SCO1/SenC/PrrC family)